MIKLNARELRVKKSTPKEQRKMPKNDIYIVLDNVLDTYNIGSIFRLADAVAAKELIITGTAEVPPNSRIKKASINTTEWVKWRYASTALEAIAKLKTQNTRLNIIAVEQGEGSVLLSEMKVDFPVVVVVGNETCGVSGEVLKMADQIIEIPMWGVNKSLNVMVSLAVVLFKLMESLD